jgi:NitT/TauT family transport system substrate-binding protein
MKKARKLAVVASATALALTTVVGSSSVHAAGTDVKIEVGGLNKQIYLPFMLAQNLGMYARYGVNVQLVDEPAGGDATNDMVAGAVDLTGGFYDHTIDLQTKGKPAESVAQLLQSPGEVELCRADLASKIKSPADWKQGVNLGVTGLGSSTNFITRAIAAHAGVPVEKIHSVVIGAGATFIAAFKQKTVDCGMTTEPTISSILQQNLGYVLVDMRYGNLTRKALGGQYVATSVYGMTDWINSHAATVQKVVNAMYDTMQWIDKHTPAEIAAKMPADYYAGVGLDAYVKALSDEKVMYNPSTREVIGGPLGVLKIETAGRIAAGSWTQDQINKVNLNQTYTDSFVKAAVKAVSVWHAKAKSAVGAS